MTTLFRTATEYLANQITFTRGTVSDVVTVGVYMNTDPSIVPTPAQFTTVLLISHTTTPASPLLDGTKTDIVSKVGPGFGSISPGHLNLTPGDYQRWTSVSTADEFIIRRPDVVTIA